MAKFCGTCGSKLEKDICPKCDTKIVEKDETQTTSNTNGLAVTGFVFSLVSILFTIFAIPGLICSICALSQIKKSKEEGSGLATAGIIISAIILGFTIIFLFFFVLALIGASYY